MILFKYFWNPKGKVLWIHPCSFICLVFHVLKVLPNIHISPEYYYFCIKKELKKIWRWMMKKFIVLTIDIIQILLDPERRGPMDSTLFVHLSCFPFIKSFTKYPYFSRILLLCIKNELKKILCWMMKKIHRPNYWYYSSTFGSRKERSYGFTPVRPFVLFSIYKKFY